MLFMIDVNLSISKSMQRQSPFTRHSSLHAFRFPRIFVLTGFSADTSFIMKLKETSVLRREEK